ncbi:type VI secretion system baseplate subunit TssG [Cytophagaceae bacterium DM2B3-1]|uniref:Type VI secretion system baseplate subunit TssG n=1 Tax=Xanthocytophaga flava TaxID=3048013 RepID=A0ABT7CIT3_9BACT|nr:type VI secretion system baseplate subunit TssG [Xanthocytophaga flavus]MDJ1493633.1 type VI secretion system baseplate subunit TssG [Xanthocytophaga flavus]
MDSINEISSDYKVEQIAAHLFELLGVLDPIIVQRKSSSSRPYNKDIARIYNDTSEFDLSTLWIFETHRMRIYDSLPENLFHEPTLGAVLSTEEEIIEQIRRRRDEAQAANQFFAPFEQELSYLTVVMHFIENKLGQVVAPPVIDIFAHYWPFLKEIDSVSAMIFLYILPFLHKVRGNYAWMEKYLSLFTGAPVQIREEQNKVIPVEEGQSYYVLGEQHLGEDMLLAGSFYDGEIDIVIEIGPVKADKVDEYKTGASFNAILQEIYRFFIPVTKRYRQYVFVEEENRGFVLGGSDYSTLGFSSYL